MTDPAPAPRLAEADLAAVDAIVAPSDERLARLYPGDPGARQPVHTVYLPADRMRPDITQRWGAAAQQALDEHAPDLAAMCRALTGSGTMPDNATWQLLSAKLDSEPIEDLRIDLEDGYGPRDDATEDADVVAAVRALADAAEEGVAPPFCGIRIRSMEQVTRRRALRTLDLALGALLERGPLPDGWVVTLPKVTSLEQVDGMVEACRLLEGAYGLPEGRLRFEVQVETPQAILGPDGSALLARVVHGSDGRLAGLHFGTYDFTASLGIAPEHQSMHHLHALHAKSVMALATAGTGVRVSDGSLNRLPIGSTQDVHAGWAEHVRLVRQSLELGFHQGWDLHPAQLPSRFIATYVFYRRAVPDGTRRLRDYLSGRTAGGSVLDEPATAQALAADLLRGVRCGAVLARTAEELTGADLDTLTRLANRRAV